MRAKKAKGLRRLATALVIQSKRPLNEIDTWYKRMKLNYKATKGEI